MARSYSKSALRILVQNAYTRAHGGTLGAAEADSWVELGVSVIQTLRNIKGSAKFILNTIADGILAVGGSTGNVLIYTKTKVEITANEPADETLTTNAGKLATDDQAAAFPAFTSLPRVWLTKSYQSAEIVAVGDPTLSGTDVTFKLQIEAAGNPASDGKFYCDIAIVKFS